MTQTEGSMDIPREVRSSSATTSGRWTSFSIPHFSTMTSRTDRFERKANPKPTPNEKEEIVRFEPEEEAVCDICRGPNGAY